MSAQLIETVPRLHNEIYPAISPDKFSNSFKSQVVVVTGASGTIGQAIAQSFARAGADLYLVAFKSPKLEAIKEKCLSEGAGRVITARYDLSQSEACESLQRDAIHTMGHVDVLVNNAGVPGVRLFHTQNPSDFTKDIAVNLHGPVCLLRQFLPHFMDRRMGCVINVVSRAGSIDVPFNSSYSTSKAALIRLTGCVQLEVDMLGFPDIHLYAMHPGAVLTGMTQATEFDPNILKHFPDFKTTMSGWLEKFKDSPFLAGMTSVALASGMAKKILRGRYFDCEQDLGDVLAQGEEISKKPYYTLGVQFPGGLLNDGGMENLDSELPNTDFSLQL